MLAVHNQVPWPENVHSEGYQTLMSTQRGVNDPVVILIHVKKENNTDPMPFVEHNYLRYFRKIYESRGWTTLQCTPSSDITKNQEECRRTVQSVLACLEVRGLHQCPLVLHLLGPRAISVYNEFTRSIKQESDDLFQIQGCIVDSAPVRPSGIATSLKKKSSILFSIYLILRYILATVFPEFFQHPADFDSFEQFCYNKNISPQLFLYSTCDHVVDPDDVENAINIRHRAGVPVEKRCWSDSDHTRHLFTHELEYTSLCQNFVERVIRGS